MGAFTHAQQAEAAFIFIDDAGVEPTAVVFRKKDDARIALDDGESKIRSAGVFQRIGERFLAEAIENGFGVHAQPLVESDHMEVDVDAGMAADFLQVQVQRRFQAEVAQEVGCRW